MARRFEHRAGPLVDRCIVRLQVGVGRWNAVIVGSLVALVSGCNWYLTTKDEGVNRLLAYSVAVLGLWVIADPFVFGDGTAAMWNDVIVGTLVASLGGYNGHAGATRQQNQAHPA